MDGPHHNGVLTSNGNVDFRKSSEIKIPVPWGYISGKWWGPNDKQPVLAIHGWQDNAGTWDALVPLLPDDISLLCIDLPGHGLSSHYPAGLQYYLFWDGIMLVRRIIKHFNWSNVTLLGHSLGGAISFLYAATFPDEVNGYISLDVASPSVKDMKTISHGVGKHVDAFLKYETLNDENIPCYSYDKIVDMTMKAYKDMKKESCEALIRRGIVETPHRLNKEGYYFSRDIRLKVSYLGMFGEDHAMAYASQIKCRVLNIRAIPGMKWENPSHYQLVLDKIKESAKELEYYEVEGSHHVHLDEPEKVANYIINFLQK